MRERVPTQPRKETSMSRHTFCLALLIAVLVVLFINPNSAEARNRFAVGISIEEWWTYHEANAALSLEVDVVAWGGFKMEMAISPALHLALPKQALPLAALRIGYEGDITPGWAWSATVGAESIVLWDENGSGFPIILELVHYIPDGGPTIVAGAGAMYVMAGLSGPDEDVPKYEEWIAVVRVGWFWSFPAD